MIDKAGVARRFVVAQGHLTSQLGVRVTLKVLAERMSAAHGGRRFTTGLVSQYQNGKVKNYPLDVIMAYATATGVDPGWLAFGAASGAPAPAGVTAEPPSAAHPPTGIARRGGREVPEPASPKRRKRSSG